MDPTTRSFERAFDEDDINRSICDGTPVPVKLEGVEFMFQAFVDVEKCFLTISENLDRRIILITSGSKGRIIVPSLVANFEETFGSNNRIYIFCANTLMRSVDGVDPPSNTWALGFLEHILMFNHQDDLLARMILDIGGYFFKEAQHFDDSQQLDIACQYYQWARLIYERYEKLEPMGKRTEIREINKRIDDIEQRRNPHNIDDEDDRVGGEADS
jgi:hypothetical protein